jgi:anaerobic carbon-monoxide dehydrogenase iron sulfur subunit
VERIVLDSTKCVGCRVCEAVCSLVNEGESNPAKSRIKVVRTIENVILYSIPVFCQQCETASCELVCPRSAISRNEKGVLIVDEEKCVGCKLCEIACPVGAISVNHEKRVALKCTRCSTMDEPQCVKHCYPKALQYLCDEKVGKAKANAKAQKFLEMARKD